MVAKYIFLFLFESSKLEKVQIGIFKTAFQSSNSQSKDLRGGWGGNVIKKLYPSKPLLYQIFFLLLPSFRSSIPLNDHKQNIPTWRMLTGTKSCSKKSLPSLKKKEQQRLLFLALMQEERKSRKVISMFLWSFPKQKVC